jgi:hypothetical protein
MNRTIELIVSPQQAPLQWDAFVASSPPFSIALDGYVWGGPRFDETGPRLNCNHHEEVDRLATRATCAQVLIAIRQGLFDRFRTSEGPKAVAHVNDCDEDVCMSWFLLTRHYWAEEALNPLLNRLVFLEDMLDSTAGAYPFPPDLPALRSLAWIFEPYRRFRVSGEIDKRDAASFRSVIEDVSRRIEQHIVGQGGEVNIDTRFDRLGGGRGWALVREVGAQAKTGLFAEGIRAYVSARERPDGRWTYVVGRMSPFVRFDLAAIYKACNAVDGGDTADVWGGSNTVGGSPRVRGSAMSPEELAKVVDEVTRH